MVDWDDLKYFLAVYNGNSMAAGAKLLKVDETTVGRRLANLEMTLGSKLIERKRKGYELTEAGKKVLATLLPIKENIEQLQNQIQGSDATLRGKVRVTMPESVATYLILPHLGVFFQKNPEIQIELISAAHVLNIQKREADIAIRMFRPKQTTVFAKKLGKLTFSFYASVEYWQMQRDQAQGIRNFSLIDYPDALTTKEELHVLRKIRSKVKSSLIVNGRESLISAIRAGLGVGLLPDYMALSHHKRLIKIPILDSIACDCWMVVHEDLKKNARIRAVSEFFAQCFTDHK